MTVDWAKLAEPFPDDDVKQRPGAATWDHKESCQGNRCRETRDAAKHIQFSYVDARAVAQRLDDVVTPAGWTFTSSVLPGTDVVHGRLILSLGDGLVTAREDYGYPNSERDEEPIKAAASDALKRCAVLFGIGRHLYGDNKPARSSGAGRNPSRPAAAPRPTVVPDGDPYADLPFEGDAPFPPIGSTQPNVNDPCPIHDGEVWRGHPGDLWHGPKGITPDGYCRPAGQPKKAKVR